MRKIVFFVLILALTLSACNAFGSVDQPEVGDGNPYSGMGPRAGMGPGSGMMNRHGAQVPEPYAGMANPVPADEDSLARGEEIYTTHCATCHGDYGNGDGPGGASLNPAPAPIAHTSQMMGDAYLFWRVTEGGIPFETGMIPYKDILDEASRWDVINYVRALGQGTVQPGEHMGGQPFDPAQETTQRLEMLADAVDAAVITQDEADNFNLVHEMIDAYTVSNGVSGMTMGPRADALPGILGALVDAGSITQIQADSFLDVHDRLVGAGFME